MHDCLSSGKPYEASDKIISFTIINNKSGGKTKYYAIEGMTWRQWIESDFNYEKDKFVIWENKIQKQSDSGGSSESLLYSLDETITNGRSYGYGLPGSN